ncbi:MAG: hypothetical protein GX046_00705 [Tissierellia bacterium]|nr:hypothetical protein [Tissierellia bacterium]
MARIKMNLSGSRQRISMLNRNYIKNEIFFSSTLTSELLRKTRMHLPNLSDFELLGDRAIFISPVLSGEPMLASSGLSATEKVQIIGSYLKIIKDFEDLPLYFQINLIRPENFYIVSGELKHRGVLIVEDSEFDRPLRMHHLRQGISNVMLDFIGNDLSLYSFKSYFRDLPDNSEIQNYSAIEEDIKKIYIKDLFVEENDYTEEVQGAQKAFFDKIKHINIRFVLIISFLMVLILAGALSLFGGLNIGKDTDIVPLFSIIDRNENILIVDQSYVPPAMHINEKKWSIYKNGALIKEQNTDLVNLLLPEEGNYLIRLELKDSKGNWSSAYEESYTKKYKAENQDDLDFFRWTNANFDLETYYNGTKSLVLNKDSSKARITGLYLNGSILIEFMLKNTSQEEINFTLEGYSKGILISEKTMQISLKPNAWLDFSMEMNSEEIQEIVISFKDIEETLWIDDLRLSSTIIPGFEM